jgi:hypothetical protein
MAEVLRLREAARLIGVSPGRLYRAISDGRLTAAPGGGPGKPTLVNLEALQTFCRSEVLRVPDVAEVVECSGRAERSMDVHRDIETLAGQYLVRVMERQSNYFDRFLTEELTHLVERVVEQMVDQVVERIAERFTASPTIHLERPERSGRAERSMPVIAAPMTKVLEQSRMMQVEGLSLQAMANRLNNEGVPMLSGKGRWQKGTIGNLLPQGEEWR